MTLVKVATVFFIVVIACGAAIVAAPFVRTIGQDPLASLSEATLSDVFTSAYWMREKDLASTLWNRATAACASPAPSAAPRPNCVIVNVVASGGAQEKLARELLEERARTREWIRNGASGEISDGLTGRGARDVPSGFGPNRTNGAAE
jgi:hypothetical protein